MAGYRLGKKKSGGNLIKIFILIFVALAFWYRFHHCYHPYINPMEDEKNSTTIEENTEASEK